VIIEPWSEGDSHILWFCEDRRLMGARIRVQHPRERYPANRVCAIIKFWTAENSCITHSGDDGRAAEQPKAEYGTEPSPREEHDRQEDGSVTPRGPEVKEMGTAKVHCSFYFFESPIAMIGAASEPYTSTWYVLRLKKNRVAPPQNHRRLRASYSRPVLNSNPNLGCDRICSTRRLAVYITSQTFVPCRHGR